MTFIDEDPDNADFWSALGGQVEITNAGEDDAAAEKASRENTELFRVSHASGAVEFTALDAFLACLADDDGSFVSGRDVGSASRHAQTYCEDVEEKLREAHTFLQQHFGGDKGAYLRLLRRVFGGTQKMRSRRCRRSGARHGAFEHYHPPSHPPSFPTALSVGADDCANNAQCLNGRLRSPTRARTTQRPRRRIPFFSVQRCRSPWATAPPSRSTSVC